MICIMGYGDTVEWEVVRFVGFDIFNLKCEYKYKADMIKRSF